MEAVESSAGERLRSVEELCERARELEIDSRSAMSKDELIAALRQHAKYY